MIIIHYYFPWENMNRTWTPATQRIVNADLFIIYWANGSGEVDFLNVAIKIFYINFPCMRLLRGS